MYELLGSFRNFIEQLLSFEVVGSIQIYHIILFFIIISGIFLLIRILLEGRK